MTSLLQSFKIYWRVAGIWISVLPSLAALPLLAGPAVSSSSSASPQSLETQGRFAVDFPAPTGVMLSVSVPKLSLSSSSSATATSSSSKSLAPQLYRLVRLVRVAARLFYPACAFSHCSHCAVGTSLKDDLKRDGRRNKLYWFSKRRITSEIIKCSLEQCHGKTKKSISHSIF